VQAAVGAGATLRTVYLTADDAVGRSLAATAGAEVVVVDEATLRRISTTETPQSPVATVVVPAGTVAAGGRVVVAWALSDPGNCGTLIRLAAGFGFGYLSGPESADPWSPKVLRSAAGAHFTTSLGAVSNLDEVRAGGRRLYATVVRGGAPPGPLENDVAVLIGNEALGLPAEVVAGCDATITIPMTGAVESLNAATAAAIVLYAGAAGPGTNLSRP
jgi:TrmH family RNA methyltransferase